METTPEVSLIVPTLGKRPSLTRALESALAQDFSSLEILMVDDSPAPGEWRERPEWKKYLADPRVRVVGFHQGRGCAAAKNAGWQAARGRWICYLDDDNACLPDRVSAQHALAVATGSPVVLCGLEYRIRERRRIRQVDQSAFRDDELLLEAVPDTNVIFHSREAGSRWDESLGTVDDACLFHSLVREFGLREVPNVARPLVIYEVHAGERANRDFTRHYRGQRRLLVSASRAYGDRAHRIMRLRILLSFEKFRSGNWSRLLGRSCRLLREGGGREWRVVANVVGSRTPLIRRWMIG